MYDVLYFSEAYIFKALHQWSESHCQIARQAIQTILYATSNVSDSQTRYDIMLLETEMIAEIYKGKRREKQMSRSSFRHF